MKTPFQNPDPKRRALGRGLESLLPSRPSAPPPAPAPVAVAGNKGEALEIKLAKIERNPFQTRTFFDPDKLTELAQSIAATGVIQAITVRPLGEGRYQLINGERRLRASQQAGKQTIPAIVRVVSDEQAMEMTIVENLQRADLNAMEQARAYARLSLDFHMTQEQMAVRTGKDRASVANFLRLLKLPELLQHRVEKGDLSYGHARALLALPTREVMEHVAARIVLQSMSVRQAENYIQDVLNPDKRDRPEGLEKVKEPLDPNVLQAQLLLQRRLGLRVRIEDKKGKGRVTIEYANLEDFDLLMGALGGLE
jgi:ParB family chromosome partitioning protein